MSGKDRLHSFSLHRIYDAAVAARGPAAALRPTATSETAPKLRAKDVAVDLDLVIQFRGDSADIERLANGRFVALDPLPDTDIREGAGLFSSADLAALAELPNVVGVRESEIIRTTLNYSLPETRTTDLRQQFSGMTGAGVTVVLIDVGIEWRHGAFMGVTGTRIQRLWDLTRTAGAGETAGPGRSGVVYLKADIDNNHTINSKDEGAGGQGHGSIVAGIAAGNGAPASCTVFGCCRRGGTFVGVAPEADIVAVRVNSVNHIFFALTFLAQDPALAGKRVVVNISMGMDDGPHDGTHRLEQAIDRFTASGPTRFVVVAAGNSAGRKTHAIGTVPAAAGAAPGTVDVPARTKKGDAESNTLAFYHFAINPLTVQVIAPSGNASAVFPTNGQNQTIVDGVQLTFSGAPLNNGANGGEIELRLTAAGPGKPLDNDDNWIVRFANAAAQAVAIDCRVATTTSTASWRFLGPSESGPNGLRATDQGTITTPATATSAIAVANYQNRESWCDFGWSGDIDANSGRGPGRGNVATMVKPTIAAPGEGITAPKADAANLRGNLCSCCPDWLIALYDDDSGTSMAAPHVTGAIALMLQVNPTMTQNQLTGYLRNSARAGPVPADPNVWGLGKLDVNAAVALALKDHLESQQPHAAASSPAATVPATPAPVPPVARATSLSLADLMQSARRTPDGERFAALVSRHFSEARRLINTQAKVATTWRRAGGPAVLVQLVIKREPLDGYRVLEDADQRRSFRRFLEQMRRFASPRLQHAIDIHGDGLIAWLTTPAAAHQSA